MYVPKPLVEPVLLNNVLDGKGIGGESIFTALALALIWTNCLLAMYQVWMVNHISPNPVPKSLV